MYEFVYATKDENRVRFAATPLEFLRACHDAFYDAVHEPEKANYRAQKIQIFKINRLHKIAKYYEIPAGAGYTYIAIYNVIAKVLEEELKWYTTVSGSNESYIITTAQKSAIITDHGNKNEYDICIDREACAGSIIIGFNCTKDPDKSKALVISHEGISPEAIEVLSTKQI